MSLITGNKVKKKHKSQGIVKKKRSYFHDLCAKKMFEQKRFVRKHLLTFESQKLNYFGKKVGPAF
jgi:hypothetical protein